MSLRDDLLGIVDIPTEVVHVKAWNRDVHIKGLTAAERDSFEAASITGKGKNRDVNMRNMRARLLVRTIVDEDGKRVFKDSDEEALGNKSAQALNQLFDVASRLSGLSDDDVEELTKN